MVNGVFKENGIIIKMRSIMRLVTIPLIKLLEIKQISRVFYGQKNIIFDIALRSIVALVCSNYRIVKEPNLYEVLIPENLKYFILKYESKPKARVLKKVISELKPYCTELTFNRN